MKRSLPRVKTTSEPQMKRLDYPRITQITQITFWVCEAVAR